MVNAWIGATIGLAVQIIANGSRQLPLSRHPWEHLVAMGMGAYVGKIWGDYQQSKKERKLFRWKRDLEQAREENRRIKRQQQAKDTNEGLAAAASE
eukprot:jgi/Galph1/2044/GphlegSOOS_G705.1